MLTLSSLFRQGEASLLRGKLALAESAVQETSAGVFERSVAVRANARACPDF